MNTIRFLCAIALAFHLLVPFAMAQPKPKPAPKAKPATYVVVEITKASFQIMKTDEAKAAKKEAADNHKDALKDWEKAKKAARKEKREFDDPKPVKPLHRKAAGPFKTEEDARKWLDKKKEKDEKKKRGKDK